MNTVMSAVTFANKSFGGLCLVCVFWLIQELIRIVLSLQESLEAKRLLTLYRDAKLLSDIIAENAIRYALSCVPPDTEPSMEVAKDYFFANMPQVFLMAIEGIEHVEDMGEWLDVLLSFKLAIVITESFDIYTSPVDIPTEETSDDLDFIVFNDRPRI